MSYFENKISPPLKFNWSEIMDHNTFNQRNRNLPTTGIQKSFASPEASYPTNTYSAPVHEDYSVDYEDKDKEKKTKIALIVAVSILGPFTLLGLVVSTFLFFNLKAVLTLLAIKSLCLKKVRHVNYCQPFKYWALLVMNTLNATGLSGQESEIMQEKIGKCDERRDK